MSLIRNLNPEKVDKWDNTLGWFNSFIIRIIQLCGIALEKVLFLSFSENGLIPDYWKSNTVPYYARALQLGIGIQSKSWGHYHVNFKLWLKVELSQLNDTHMEELVLYWKNLFKYKVGCFWRFSCVYTISSVI